MRPATRRGAIGTGLVLLLLLAALSVALSVGPVGIAVAARVRRSVAPALRPPGVWRLADTPSPGWAPGLVAADGGPWLTDSAGRRLQLHGVNLVGKCGGGAVDLPAAGQPCVGPSAGPRLAYVLSPLARDPGRRFTAADASRLARLGLRVVRLGILWEGLEPGPEGVGPDDPAYCAPHRPGTPWRRLGRSDPFRAATVAAYLRRTDRIIGELAAAGLRVILDMHSDVYGSAFSNSAGATPWQGDGAPAWATCTGGRPFTAPSGWGSGYGDLAVQTAIHHFFANDVAVDLQAQYARVWQAVATHYRAATDVLGYELYNEPDDYLTAHFDAELQCDEVGPRLAPGSCRLARPQALSGGWIGAVRAADPTHPVLYEPSGATDFGAPETLGIAEPLRLSGLVLAFHAYGDPPLQLRQTAAERARTRTDQAGGPAWILDEFGADDNPAADGATVDAAGALDLSWVYWSAAQLHDPTPGSGSEGLLSSTTRRPLPAMARALAVPYPFATAGVPGRQSWTPASRTFRYVYRVDRRITAPTVIEVPRAAYPAGYAVAVRGARITSPRGARELLLTARPRARVVTVRLVPAQR
jgi:endoglycosylceramidase